MTVKCQDRARFWRSLLNSAYPAEFVDFRTSSERDVLVLFGSARTPSRQNTIMSPFRVTASILEKAKKSRVILYERGQRNPWDPVVWVNPASGPPPCRP